jgi:hypothetical protein
MGKCQSKFYVAGFVLLSAVVSVEAAFDPWDALVFNPAEGSSWTDEDPTPAKIYSVNGTSYDMAFKHTFSTAGGMNALLFRDGGGNTTGHLKTNAWAGSFEILNTGDKKDLGNILIMVAIDADTLPQDFSLSLGEQGQVPYVFNNNDDFCAYDPVGYTTYRPSGYHWSTNPTQEGIGYDFDTGILTIYELPGVTIPKEGGSVTVEYAFTDLPGRAVFSVYGSQDSTLVKHTNRAIPDLTDPALPISTFEVVPEPCGIALLLLGAGIFYRKKHSAV